MQRDADSCISEKVSETVTVGIQELRYYPQQIQMPGMTVPVGRNGEKIVARKSFGKAAGYGAAPNAKLDDATVAELLAFAGMAGDGSAGLPEDSAGIQALIEAVPVELRDRLLTGFFSLLFTPRR